MPDFLSSVPVLDRFSRTVDPESYRPVPEGWLIGLADVTDSTGAIASGNYKMVNVAGAAVIAGMSNALGGRTFPFAFGGDGASFLLPGPDRALASRVLSEAAAMVRDEFGLELRTAIVPVSDVREVGHDVRLAFFSASPDVRYAMFSGGGLRWAESAMKAGRYAIAPGSLGSRPDLTGLSCRFEPVTSRRGVILSLIVLPSLGADTDGYRALAKELLAKIDSSPDMARPLPDGGPALAWPPGGLEIEARIMRPGGHALLPRRVLLLAKTFLSYLLFRFGLRAGRFDPAAYTGQLVRNSDYRKYDDGLRLTIDCAPELADWIDGRLSDADSKGLISYGTHRQAEAIVTCYTPSVHRSDHVHFVDGGSGGYAAASARIKASTPADLSVAPISPRR